MRVALAAGLLAAGLLSPPVYAQEEHRGHGGHAESMPGMLGPYGMTREASGTSWQPEAASMEGLHRMAGDWMLMAHGFANLVYDDQGGKRGDNTWFSSNMMMGMAQRPLGPGTLGLRGMWTLEPATVGRKGYPLLLQTGETDNGRTPLIDRQHPHDLFMEMAGTYSLPVGEKGSFFTYLGLPGEPALGPPTFMHRFSGMDNPEAPITHHWLDSTHISFGVATLGYARDRWKIEGSAFNGHEPDQDRWDIETRKLDSFSGRLSFNPTDRWALQASFGRLRSPEQLEPGVDTDRTTVSAMHHRAWSENNWQTTFTWGRNQNDPGKGLDGLLLESALNFHRTHTLFGRIERVKKNELFQEGDGRHPQAFWVNKLSLGYIYDFPEWHPLRWGLGGVGSLSLLPDSLEEEYGDAPASFMLFFRVKL